ncbi:MAG: excinuclease ABC subunit UvrC [Saprospiraceae bacterium]|nr:excinuclease ABC subunit UvrC [Saprospiraceae bacterium]
MTTKEFREFSPSIPKEPGVYRFLDEENTILYVGKAKNLKNRLNSYFGEKKHQQYKTKALVRNAHHIEFTIVDSEHDALLLENTLIKKNQPRYNVSLKDGKSYTYLCIKNERFPRVFFTRRVIRDGSAYFGPFTSKYRTKVLLEVIKRLFPLRTCTFNLSQGNINKGKFKVCLEYHIKNCKGPCEGLEDEDDYNDKINQVKNILRGNFKQVKDYLKKEMAEYAETMQFELAQQIKDKLDALEDYQAKSTVVSATIKDVDVFTIQSDEKYAFVNYIKVINGAMINSDTIEMEKNLDEDEADLLSFVIPVIREKYNSIAPEVVVPFDVEMEDTSIVVTIPQRGDKAKLMHLSEKNVSYHLLQKKKAQLNNIGKQTSAERILRTLQNDLQMDVLPFHLECFDNSNIQGTNPTASCVVFKNAKPSKKDYRHFKIKTVEGPNDFASMEEVVYRRYHRLIKEETPLPQLIIIDGGKGQLSSAVKSLRKLDILNKVTIIGIAKKLEELYFPDDPIPLHINKKSESLKLIQQARDEAHRFALTLHRNLRSKHFLGTELTDIPGIGKKTAEQLLTTYKSVNRIKKQTEDSLATVVGKSAAKKVFTYFNPELD